jgi:hypothetical protein
MNADNDDEASGLPPLDMSRAVMLSRSHSRSRPASVSRKRSRAYDGDAGPRHRSARSRLSSALGIDACGDADDDADGVVGDDGDADGGDGDGDGYAPQQPRPRKIARVVANREPPAADLAVMNNAAGVRGGSSESEVSEVYGALPPHQWRADNDQIPPCGRDDRYVQCEDDMHDAITERRDDYCFLCTMSGEYSATHAGTLSDMWHAGITSHTLFTTAKHVSAYYDENIRMFTEFKRRWPVRSVFEHFTSHVIDETTLTVMIMRDHLQVAMRQMYMLNAMTSDNRLAPLDPAAVAVYTRLCQYVLKLRRDLNGLGGGGGGGGT